MSSADISRAEGRGHELLVLATSCWVNGLWSDALGERVDAREEATHARCVALLDAVERPRADEAALRAVDPVLVEAVERRLWRTALDDRKDAPRAKELVQLLTAVAGASREMLRVHRLADEVRGAAAAGAGEPRAEHAGVAQQLRDAAALRALLRVTGAFAADARTLGLMLALDRMDLARDLPVHLRLDALSGVFLEVFGVASPRAPRSADAWLAYLGDVAAAARHPIPELSSAATREALAWDGILEGFAERLRAGAGEGTFGRVARGVADRIDAAHVR